LGELVAQLEDQGIDLKIRPVPQKYLTYEIQMPQPVEDHQHHYDEEMYQNTINTLRRHEL